VNEAVEILLKRHHGVHFCKEVRNILAGQLLIFERGFRLELGPWLHRHRRP
jgi:hypothetical protein